MLISKNKVALTLLVGLLGVAGCTDAQKETADNAKEAALVKLEKAKDKTVEMAEDASEKADDMLEEAKKSISDSYETAKDETADLVEDSKETAAELKVKTATKLREACIAAKEKMDQDPSDCD